MKYEDWLPIGGIALGSALTFLGTWWGKRAEWFRADSRRDSSSVAQERIEQAKRWQNIVDSQEVRIKNSEADRQRLWDEFKKMQDALYLCEQCHISDAQKIAELTWTCSQQEMRIKLLEDK